MQLINWEPLSEIDRFFDNFAQVSFPKFGWDTSIDLYEEKGNLVAKMNVPGIDPDKIKISVDENAISVSGSREESKEEKEKHYYSKEIRRGMFERSVRLPKSVDRSKVDAEYKNGTLSVVMPILKIGKEAPVEVKVRK